MSRITVKRAALSLVAVAVLIQLVPAGRSNPPARGGPDAPAAVQATFRRACYDCHSNETRWPWYSHVAPVSWLVAHDVHEGRGNFNFSTWDTLSTKERADLMADIAQQVRKGRMPLGKYLLIHKDARLTHQDVAAIEAWAATAPPSYEMNLDDGE
jgi:mono/diheme cytochrome c family protein